MTKTTRVGILHGYLLDGSGSNIWTRNICEALARAGYHVDLFCQENHPERYPFIEAAFSQTADGQSTQTYKGHSAYPGSVTLHRPEIGDILPVFVADTYEGFSKAVPMVDLSDAFLGTYVSNNLAVVRGVVKKNRIQVLLANHTLLMPTVAQKLHAETGIPYSVVPHGSAIEYVVKQDRRLQRVASDALQNAAQVFHVSDEMRTRILDTFPDIPALEKKLTPITVGVDTQKFQIVDQKNIKPALATLLARVNAMPTGRSSEHVERLKGLSNATTHAEYLSTIKENSTYLQKGADRHVADRLASIAWGKTPTVLFVGRLIAAKGIQALLWALPNLTETVPDLRVIIVGQGPLREPLEAFLHALQSGQHTLAERILDWGSVLEPIEAQSYFKEARVFWDHATTAQRSAYLQRAAKLKPSNILFTGFLGHAELAALYPLCDVAVFPSLVPEAGPMVFLEAMASGCFPAGVNQAGIRSKLDRLEAHIPKTLCDRARFRRDQLVEDLAASLPTLLQHAATHKGSLRRITTAHYDWTKIAQDLYCKLTGSIKT